MEDVVLALVLLAGGAAGLRWLFWSATEKLRVLLSCRAWELVEGEVVSARVLESRTTHWVSPDDPSARLGPGVRVEHDRGFYGLWAGPSKVTTTTVTPEVKLAYQVGGRGYAASNLDRAWNYRLGYTRQEAERWVAHFAPGSKHRLRVNPRAPREVFLGWRHFPWVWAPLQWVLGFCLGVAPLAAACRSAVDELGGDGLVVAQRLMIGLGAASPAWILARVALDALRGRPAPGGG